MEIGGGSSSSKVIPEGVMGAIKRTSSNIDEVKSNLEELLSYCTNETLSRMEPLERAQTLLLIAKVTTTLFALRLRCKGVDPDDHPVRKEFERLSLYQEKLQQSMNLNKDDIKQVPVWITLPRLPIELYSANALSRIASCVGRPIRTDKLTRTIQRANIAFRSGVSFVQEVIFENEPMYCTSCKNIGHNVAKCKRGKDTSVQKPRKEANVHRHEQPRMEVQKPRKENVQQAEDSLMPSQGFLEKAARELLGDS